MQADRVAIVWALDRSWANGDARNCVIPRVAHPTTAHHAEPLREGGEIQHYSSADSGVVPLLRVVVVDDRRECSEVADQF